MKKLLLILLKIGVVGSILVYLIQSGRLNFEKLMLFRDAPEILALMVGVLFFAVVPMAALRWWLLLRAIGVPLKPKQTFLLTWIGNFFNTTLPGAVTGDVVKGYYVIKAQHEEGRTRAFMTLLIDRFVGLFGLIVMAFFALIFNLELILSQDRLHSLAWIIVALFVGTVLFYAIVLFPFKEGRDPFIRLFQRLPAKKFSLKVYSAFKSYQHQKRTLALTLLLSIGIHTLVALLFFQVTLLMGIKEMELATQFFLMPTSDMRPLNHFINLPDFPVARIFSTYSSLSNWAFISWAGSLISFTAANIKFQSIRKKCLKRKLKIEETPEFSLQSVKSSDVPQHWKRGRLNHNLLPADSSASHRQTSLPSVSVQLSIP